MTDPLRSEETSDDPVDQLLARQAELGAERYVGEEVMQLAHALQCATFAQRARTPDRSVAAALMHDVGPVVNPKDEVATQRGVDAAHVSVGAAWLARWFEPAVAQHVAANRYLCQVEEAYHAKLSDESVRSLTLQGGPFSKAEAIAFLANPYAADTVTLRRGDELVKDPEMRTPSLEGFRPVLERERKA